MQIKLFGKSLFEIGASKASQYLELASNSVKESKYLPDFYIAPSNSTWISGSITAFVTDNVGEKVDSAKKEKKEPATKHLTPKEVHELKLLHDKTFKINIDPTYIEQQLAVFKDKLGLIKSEEYDMNRGVQEIASVVTRLENRKKYKEFQAFFEEFPYTTSSRIDKLVKTHDYLQLGQVAQFVADMPKEAVDVMKDYNKNINKLCGKQAVFYIVADKKDFEKSNKRRDPILLAQSPFGHFWQVLGAWDEEMLFLEEL